MRQTNIELCRIFAIMFVVIVHSDFAVFGYPESLKDTNILLLLVESFAIIGVNVFVLITGYFSTTPKWISLIKLAYICFFYAVLRISFNFVMSNPISLKSFLFISRSNWFIPCYLGLLLFAPVLNSFCDTLSKRQLQGTITLMVIYEVYMGWLELPQLNVGFNRGYSVLSFMVLYLIARYIKLYGVTNKWKQWSGTIYFLCSTILTMIAYYCIYFGYGRFTYKLYAYINPLIILSSISFFLSFEKWNLKNNKVINHIAKSVLAVLLIHACSETTPYIHKNYLYIYSTFSGLSAVILWTVSILMTCLFCLLVDQTRLFSYNNFLQIIIKKYNGIQNPII